MGLRRDIEHAMPDGDKKVSKRLAHYGGGMKQSHCSICRHFEPPDACEYVEGVINPQAWCKFFETKKRKT